jgi:hypothetical protein
VVAYNNAGSGGARGSGASGNAVHRKGKRNSKNSRQIICYTYEEFINAVGMPMQYGRAHVCRNTELRGKQERQALEKKTKKAKRSKKEQNKRKRKRKR